MLKLRHPLNVQVHFQINWKVNIPRQLQCELASRNLENKTTTTEQTRRVQVYIVIFIKQIFNYYILNKGTSPECGIVHKTNRYCPQEKQFEPYALCLVMVDKKK